jgi:hypothetical protein
MKAILVSLLFTASMLHAGDTENPLLGLWHNKTDPTITLWFQPKKVAWVQNGQLQLGLVRYDADKVQLLFFGKKKYTWFIKVNGDAMDLTAVKNPSPWLRSKEDPPKNLDVEPAPIGDAKEIAGEKVKEIQTQIKDRTGQLESMGKDPTMTAAREKLAAETNEFLKKTIADVGWIDTTRFSKATAEATFELVQKCGDIQLMAGLLPALQKEALARKLDPNGIARFYDRVKLSTGNHQRYGTQLGKSDSGEMFVLPVEDKDKVDEFRKELGLSELTKDMKERNLKFEEGF